MTKIAPSMLAADFLNIERDILKARDAGADYLHYDVMDGRFVPNITFGQGILKAVAGADILPCDVHLMIESPERYIEQFAACGARMLTVHAEATPHLNRALRQIRDCGCLAGVALNPATPPDCLRYVLGEFDMVVVMAVNPGFGGQKLIPSAADKVREIRDMLGKAGVTAEIEVDGGVNADNASTLRDAGASILVTGSAFFRAEDPKGLIAALRG
ncbi:MAG: ribulose-phosphate 3-epimerase [Clostridia bacterium]|nr:ribulose-phosphate 3-epimerase [Clostridia bacterium]